jgi:HPt (histidine-containing phosphotransfer) domain-containing protein
VPLSINDAAGYGLQGTAMLMESLRNIDAAEAPSVAPDDRPIDLVHLARTTLGDRSLEREVLQLFDRQSSLLIARMRTAAPAGIATLAHTLKGSARGIGAWRVARAAEAVEFAGGDGEVRSALDRLDAASEEARTVIADLLRAG